METKHNTSLTAPEIASLWSQFMLDSMSICFFKYALQHLEDEDIRSIYLNALQLSESHLTKINKFFTIENFPTPHGFTEEDVHVNAPRLFHDPFYLHYLYIMTMQGVTGYSLSYANSIRSDLRQYFIQCNSESIQLFEKVLDLMLNKGLLSRPPVLNPKDMISFVQQQSFLSGWFWERRPLTAMEIGDIYFNMTKMNMHITLKVGFIQVAECKEVRKLMKRGISITTKHTEVFNSIFREEKLNSPISLQSLVTDSKTSPFSDKLIMNIIQLSTQAAIAYYGAAMSVNARRDLGGHYTRLLSELLKYSEDCINLMIEKGWVEEPPMASDREQLAKE